MNDVKIKTGKPEFHRLDPQFILEMAKIGTVNAAKKYPDINGNPSWKVKAREFNPKDLLNAAFRHLMALYEHEFIDSEDYCHNAAKVAYNMMMFYFWQHIHRESMRNAEFLAAYTHGEYEK